MAATFGLSHIDRLPLGDLCGTVSALIRLNPDIDFVFRASGERAGIHPRHPRAAGDPRGRPAGRADVIAWIDAYLREQDAALEGTA